MYRLHYTASSMHSLLQIAYESNSSLKGEDISITSLGGEQE